MKLRDCDDENNHPSRTLENPFKSNRESIQICIEESIQFRESIQESVQIYAQESVHLKNPFSFKTKLNENPFRNPFAQNKIFENPFSLNGFSGTIATPSHCCDSEIRQSWAHSRLFDLLKQSSTQRISMVRGIEWLCFPVDTKQHNIIIVWCLKESW